MAIKTASKVGTDITPDARDAAHFIRGDSVKRPVNPEVDKVLRNVALPLGIGVLMLGATLLAITEINKHFLRTEAPTVQVQSAPAQQ